jgi:hypothetical protein
MSRGAGAPRSGDATDECRRTPTAQPVGFSYNLTEAAGMSRGAGMRPSASRSRPPKGNLPVMAMLLPFVTRLRKGMSVATGELPHAAESKACGFHPTFRRWQA